MNNSDLFGRYCKIAYGAIKAEPHIYKVIQRFRSNCYSDVPLWYETEKNPYNHGEIVDVVNVIHCGIDENKVLRVAMKDIELLPDKNLCENLNDEYAECDQFICSECGIELRKWDAIERDDEINDIIHYEFVFKFCPNCGKKVKKG